MCMNCGCGEPEKRHQPTDITKDDLERAAHGSGISVEQAKANMTASMEHLAGSGDSAEATTAS